MSFLFTADTLSAASSFRVVLRNDPEEHLSRTMRALDVDCFPGPPVPHAVNVGHHARAGLEIPPQLRAQFLVHARPEKERDNRCVPYVGLEQVFVEKADTIGDAGPPCVRAALPDAPGSMSTQAPRAPSFAAAMTMRPSPQPRS